MNDKNRLLLIKSQYVRVKWPPLGLMYVAAAAEKSQAEVKIIDLSQERDYRGYLKAILTEYNPRLVGIGGMYEEFEAVKALSCFVKACAPDTKVVVGGPLGSSLAKECLQHTDSIDIIVRGEGEPAILEILEYLDKKVELNQIGGVAYRRDGEIIFTQARQPADINTIPIPAWHLLGASKYIDSKDNWFGIDNLKVMCMSVSRGCPYRCIYCDKSIFGQKWRARNPKNVVDEMILLRDTHGAQAIVFVDDIFDVNKEWVLEFLGEVKSRNLNMLWGCDSRVNHADYELYRKMHEAGCYYVFFGIEFGTDQILNKARKDATVRQAYEAIELAKRAGIRVVGSFMVGMLDESEEQINETIGFAVNSKLDAGGASIVAPIAGTPLYDMAVREGKIDGRHPWWQASRDYAFINLSKGVSDKRLSYLASKMSWMIFWSRPSRKWPKFVCRTMQLSFYLFYPFVQGRFVKFIAWLDRLRRKLRLNLP